MTSSNRNSPPQEHANGSKRPSHREGRGRGKGSQRSFSQRRNKRPISEMFPTSEAAFASIEAKLGDGNFIVFDIETTGGNPEKNGITEIFALKYRDGEVQGTFYSLVNPGIPIPPIVRRMTGIDNKMVRQAPRIEAVMPGFVEFIGSDILVSHNTIGDMKFIRYFAKKVEKKIVDNFYLCTHLLVEKLASEAPDKSLKGLAEYFKLPRGELHRAEADAYVTLELFKVLIDKLKQRSVRTIDEAVRLQGDLESGIRLGWGVKSQTLETVPPGPGVFYLYDHERKLLFLSSAMQLDREIDKLKTYSQLPRQLLRLVLRSYDLQVQRCPNPYAAMLEECDALQSHSISFHPLNWHQRTVHTLYIAEDPRGIILGIGPLVEATKFAFGPVRDRKLAGEFLDELAEVFGAKQTRNGLLLPAAAEPLVVSYLNETLEAECKEMQKRSRSFKLFWRPSERHELKSKLRIMKRLLALKKKPRLQPLLNKSGVLIVPDKQNGTWQVHSIVASRPKTVTTLKGEPESKFKLAGFGRRIQERIERECEKLVNAPLSAADVGRINATLWWIFNGRSEGRFVELKDIPATSDMQGEGETV